MYSIALTFSLLKVINNSSEPLTVSAIVELLVKDENKLEKTDQLRQRIYRHLRQLERLDKVAISKEKTELKTEYLLIYKK